MKRTPKRERRDIQVQGIVQGVGFRPFVYGLARTMELMGQVSNDARGVHIEVEGESSTLDEFLRLLRDEPPPLAHIESVAWNPLPLHGDTTFVIAASHRGAEKQAFISPDVCLCDDCRREMNDPADRRFGYPFINCTNCGPRFTIIKDVPYDRPATTMASFMLCNDCRREYEDPGDRRFHAQPNACPQCGPHLILQDANQTQHEGEAALPQTAKLLHTGKIVAIKGLGGYHLACDATDESAVRRLRMRKHRFDKPFAAMVSDLASARQFCVVNEAEASLLESRQRPIVLLRAHEARGLVGEIAPRQRNIGVMLPCAPLHFLLLDAFEKLRGDQPVALVMTSGNLSDEPIAFHDDEARSRLAGIADAFLSHNREIYMRCDDAVARIFEGRPIMVRRARGYAPEPIDAPQEFCAPLLATGAHLKNTFCLGKEKHAFVSHHIGDLENRETLASFTEGIAHFKKLFDIEPRIVAHDLHPEYLTTKHALELGATQGLTTIGVQHHHAHIAAVTGEHDIGEPVIGVAFDGTGYGTDGTLWGGEFMVADWRSFERAAHLQTLPLIGGAVAIREVWRLAAAWLYATFGEAFLDLEIDFVRRLDRKRWHIMQQMVQKEVNVPSTSALGRRFDAIAALLGLRDLVNYEAQAAIELEMIAAEVCSESYPFGLTATCPQVVCFDETLRAIVDDLKAEVSPGIVAAKWHNTVATSTIAVCKLIRRERGLQRVALGGGVFQNALLLERTVAMLRACHFEVLLPSKLPFNDGAISFGQAVVANAQLREVAS